MVLKKAMLNILIYLRDWLYNMREVNIDDINKGTLCNSYTA